MTRHASFDVVRPQTNIHRIVIRDGDGFKSVTNDAEWVIQMLKPMGISGRRVFYYDTDGEPGELIHDGERFIRFGPASEADLNDTEPVDVAIVAAPSVGFETRALRLADQVMKTWNPPRLSGSESKADIAQTAVMQTIAFIMGPEFLPEMTPNQQAAIDGGLELLRTTLG